MFVISANVVSAQAALNNTNPAESLRAHYVALSHQTNHNQFKQLLYLDSSESSGNVKGDIYARIDYPFSAVNAALNGPAHWCDVLILHVNTKYCRASTLPTGTVLIMNIGSKHAQLLKDTHRIEFAYHEIAGTPSYFQVQLDAGKGPLSTSNYRILLEAISVSGSQTFLHLKYSYAYGLPGLVAMKAYLATIGRDKVGFTVVGKQPDGQPDYIAGVRGLVERNTMRYYLAIGAYLGATSAPPAEQLERRTQDWFAATERYPRQLHEVDRSAYVDMKRGEYLRQQTVY
jgi:hypothetical protein